VPGLAAAEIGEERESSRVDVLNENHAARRTSVRADGGQRRGFVVKDDRRARPVGRARFGVSEPLLVSRDGIDHGFVYFSFLTFNSASLAASFGPGPQSVLVHVP